MNRNIINSFKNIFRRGSGSITKIILLGIGLAMGLTLIAKLYFENSYESFVPDRERVYRVVPLYERNGEKMKYYSTPGAIAPGIKSYSAAVEYATRLTYVGSEIIIKNIEKDGQGTNNEGYFCKAMVIADSCFFKTFPREILAGDADKTLQEPNTALISKSMADKMLKGKNKNYRDLIGRVIAPQSYENRMLTIGAVFTDFPHNSELADFEIVIPIKSIKAFTWDGSNNWMGNDRYMSFIKLLPNTSEADVKLGIDKMCEERIMPNLSEGTKISYNIISLKGFHTSFKEVKQICLIMLILAIVVLVVAILNYILITLSSLVRKAKMVAVRKCYGASRNNIYALVFSDTFVEMFISLLLAVFLVFTFEGTVERIVGTSLSALLSPQSIAILIVVLLLVFLTCGIFPAAIYSKTPIATAFRNYKESNRRWKYVLLTVQFICSAFFISLLLVIFLQYSFVLHKDTGYAYKNLLYTEINGIEKEERDILKDEIAKLPFVTMQTFNSSLPFEGASGNNILLPDSDKELFNVADNYYADDGFFELMEIPIIAGRNFNQETPTPQDKEVMVSRSCAEKLKMNTGWDDVLGHQIYITEHCRADDYYTICGIYEDYLIGDMSNNKDERPSVQFYIKGDNPAWNDVISYHLMKLNEINAENIKAVSEIYKERFPDKEIEINSYSEAYKSQYDGTRNYRDTILIAGLVVLIITLIGLIGYCQDEMNRRSSELAVRKINGATLGELLQLFLLNVLKMAVIAVIVGSVAAYAVSGRLMELFTDTINLSWWIYTAGAIATLLIVTIVVIITTYKAANVNPVEILKK
ncbi:MAG: hypothetical protein PHY65_09735 [Bacteroidales bacterium]|nr:hypothetical protein [Bacteroidales bacterium]